jgi:hypothetical protein
VRLSWIKGIRGYLRSPFQHSSLPGERQQLTPIYFAALNTRNHRMVCLAWPPCGRRQVHAYEIRLSTGAKFARDLRRKAILQPSEKAPVHGVWRGAESKIGRLTFIAIILTQKRKGDHRNPWFCASTQANHRSVLGINGSEEEEESSGP